MPHIQNKKDCRIAINTVGLERLVWNKNETKELSDKIFKAHIVGITMQMQSGNLTFVDAPVVAPVAPPPAVVVAEPVPANDFADIIEQQVQPTRKKKIGE